MGKIHILSDRRLNSLIEQRISEYTEKTSRTYERELLMKQANISTLQAQINPHFLYNALECIRAQAILQDADQIAEVTQALSRFFRYNISNKGDIITLKDELDNIRNYMLIQQYRFKDRMSLEFNYDEEDSTLLNMRLPKLVFQPIVENSILHGFKNLSSGAKITITAKRTNKHADIVISDNGEGMDVSELQRVRDKLNAPGRFIDSLSETAGTGIALTNVSKRIELFFGQSYTLDITSCRGAGTDVEFFLPLKMLSEAENE